MDLRNVLESLNLTKDTYRWVKVTNLDMIMITSKDMLQFDVDRVRRSLKHDFNNYLATVTDHSMDLLNNMMEGSLNENADIVLSTYMEIFDEMKQPNVPPEICRLIDIVKDAVQSSIK